MEREREKKKEREALRDGGEREIEGVLFRVRRREGGGGEDQRLFGFGSPLWIGKRRDWLHSRV